MPCHKLRPSILRKFAIAIALALMIAPACAAQKAQPAARLACGSPTDETAPALDKLLTEDKTCTAAHARLNACAWGSSADVQFAAIVIEKCTRTFLPKFTADQKARFKEEMDLCTYQYARPEGTLAISQTSLCHADVAAEFSAHPGLADKPIARASFDCAKAATPLEKAICSDAKLGRADLVLGRAYTSALKGLPSGEKPKLVLSERKWLKGIPTLCGLSTSSPTARTVDCIRSAFEARFVALSDCGEDPEDMLGCVDGPDVEQDRATPPAAH